MLDIFKPSGNVSESNNELRRQISTTLGHLTSILYGPIQPPRPETARREATTTLIRNILSSTSDSNTNKTITDGINELSEEKWDCGLNYYDQDDDLPGINTLHIQIRNTNQGDRKYIWTGTLSHCPNLSKTDLSLLRMGDVNKGQLTNLSVSITGNITGETYVSVKSRFDI